MSAGAVGWIADVRAEPPVSLLDEVCATVEDRPPASNGGPPYTGPLARAQRPRAAGGGAPDRAAVGGWRSSHSMTWTNEIQKIQLN